MAALPTNPKFVDFEEDTVNTWTSIDAMATQNALAKDRGDPEFTFYDGPPFATGLPHYGHILAGTIKDTVTRFAAMNGYYVERRAGWDCHGLPVEYEIDQKLKITRREQVLEMGVANYNKECRSIVTRYTGEWEKTVTRLGRWIDFKDDYKTMNPDFMESVWWVFKQLTEKGLVYQGYKVMPFSTACGTPLSNFEAGLNYKDVVDPAVVVGFPLVDDPATSFVAWTTTPWTLPSNLALCVHPELKYVKVKCVKTGAQYICGEARIVELFPEIGKKKFKKEDIPKVYEILATYVGTDLLGMKYTPLFDYFKDHDMADGTNTYFRVLNDKYVTADNGTGVVHQAPAFGEDDYRVCLAAKLIVKGKEIPCPVDCNGIYTAECRDYAGQYVKDADVPIMAELKARGRLVKKDNLTHSYPFCWRSDTPLIYKAVPSWFVKVEEIKDKMQANNAQTHWVPSHVKDVRFNNWLRDARDWAISRNRFWGTPIPVWSDADFTEVVTVGSVEELFELSGVRVTDLHKDIVDEIKIPSKKNPGTFLSRIDEVFDCWFESGSMPYAQKHYPFENKEKFEGQFPADFIAEGLDQTRGWFYTLMVLGTALFDKPPFKNVIVNGLVLAGDGKKMSKRLKNYPDPKIVIDKYGADALRMYLINSPVVRAEPLKFKEEGVLGVVKEVFLPWFNAFRFLLQNVERWEAETNNTFQPDAAKVKSSTNSIDVWLGARTQGLIKFVHNEMKAYRLYTVMPELVTFITELTNWYVRLNRERMKDVETSETALQVLYDCLLDITIMMAPFCPFLTEYFYQHLRKMQPSFEESKNGGGTKNPVMAGKTDSIHFLQLPKFDESRLSETAVQGMGLLQTIVKCGRDAREKRLISLKMPVKTMVVCCPNVSEEVKANVSAQLAPYIKTELNAWEIKFADSETEAEWVKISLLPNLGILGKKLGKNMGAVKKELVNMSHADAKAAIAAGKATVAGIEIDFKTEVLSKYVYAKEGDATWEGVIDGTGEVLVAIDTREDEELLNSGKCRDVMAAVQQLRKKAGLVVGDKIEAFYRDDGAGLEKAITANVAMFEAKFGDMLPLPVEHASKSSVVLAEVEVETAGDRNIVVDIRAPCLCVGGKVGAGPKMFLDSVDVDEITIGMELKCTVDGEEWVGKEGVDFWCSASRKFRQ